jgi:hypothetical protein
VDEEPHVGDDDILRQEARDDTLDYLDLFAYERKLALVVK